MDFCIFCLIIDKKSDSKIFSETEHVIAIHDVKPHAPVHLLIIPKIHIINMTEVNQENIHYIEKMSFLVKKISNQYFDLHP